jgi:uncharacterized protein with HEPN domain
MSRSIPHRLSDILEAVDLLVEHAGSLDAAALAVNPRQRDAAFFRIAVIGEAVSHLPAELVALAPEVPWQRVYGMRNHLVHAYWQIDLKTIADTIKQDLMPLKIATMRLIQIAHRAEQ